MKWQAWTGRSPARVQQVGEVAAPLDWTSVSTRVSDRLGLHFPLERLADLERGMKEAAVELAFPDGEACAEKLLLQGLSRREWQVLASHLTVGETYFYRERGLFEVLAQQVLPDLLERRRTTRTLRLWSAACSTGEEPYSLSILLQQCMPDLSTWNASVLATDLNERSLARAAAAEYGEWSFRDVPTGFRERFFQRTPEGRYMPRPEVRQRVRFAAMNLVEEQFPSAGSSTQQMDLILCRNVLMYFTADHAARVTRKLRRALSPDGWLVLGVSESSHARAVAAGLVPVNFEGVTLYRRGAETSGKVSSPVREAAGSVAGAAFNATLPVPAPLVVPSLAPASSPGVAAAPGSDLPPAEDVAVLARRLANQGSLTEALSACDRWIGEQPLDAAARYLRAVILEENGSAEEARRCLQQAIYLQPGFVLAHFALGNGARRRGMAGEARKHFDNTLALLGRLPPEAALPESEGLTAGRLREMIETMNAGAGP